MNRNARQAAVACLLGLWGLAAEGQNIINGWRDTTPLPAHVGRCSATSYGDHIIALCNNLHNTGWADTNVYALVGDVDPLTGDVTAWRATTAPPVHAITFYQFVRVGRYLIIPAKTNSYIGLLNADGSIAGWSTGPGSTTPDTGWGKSVGTDGKYVWTIGGCCGDDYPWRDDVEVASFEDGVLSEWRPLPKFPIQMNGGMTTVINGHLYLFGGENNYGATTVSKDVRRAQIQSDGSLGPWELVGSLLEARPHSRFVQYGGTLHAMGGGVHDYATATVESVVAGSLGLTAQHRYSAELPLVSHNSGAAAVRHYGYVLGGCATVYCTALTPRVLVATLGPPADTAAPAVGDVAAMPNPAPVNTQISVTASLTDAGGSGLATARYRVDGGAILPMGPVSGNAATAIAPLAGFAAAGIHSVCVQAVDGAGNASVWECALLAVYDPAGGFVTGGGKVNSPAGAYAALPAVAGPAAFAFHSKYLPGRTTPSGEARFSFKTAGFTFESTSHEWLVVSGSKAQFKGTGTVNGTGSYSFTITAIDGKLNGSNQPDRFRLKVQGPGGVVYDNQMGASDLDDPTTTVMSGSITIHK